MDSRRDFLKKTIVGSTAFLSRVCVNAQHLIPSQSVAKLLDTSIFPRSRALGGVQIDNPYADVDWDKFQQVPSTTHVHIEDQQKLDRIYRKMGLRHMPISNYYPSAPTYPIRSIRTNQYKVQQDFGLVYNPDQSKPGSAKWAAGHFIEGPFHWNDIIMNGPHAWFNELPPSLQAQMPFELGDFIFKDVPDDIIVSPNAEHHSFTNGSLHACAVGSTYCSGNFDVHDVFKTQEHGYAIGTGLPWETAFQKMIDHFLFSDAGGITVNHPVWSGLAFDEVLRMLDFDPHVLGIEVFNDTCATDYGDPSKGWALKMWDQVLGTGRRCLGFFVPDHTVARGRNILLVPRFTEHDCLRAYRKGAFYGAIDGSGLRFTHIRLAGTSLSIATNQESSIIVTTNLGIKHFSAQPDQPVVFEIPLNEKGLPAISFVRTEAADDSSELIYSQPIRFIK